MWLQLMVRGSVEVAKTQSSLEIIFIEFENRAKNSKANLFYPRGVPPANPSGCMSQDFRLFARAASGGASSKPQA